MALSVTLNGQTRSFDDLSPGATLAGLVEALNLKADRVAVERNGEIVARSVWAATALSAGDRLEVVHFVGGGSSRDGGRRRSET